MAFDFGGIGSLVSGAAELGKLAFGVSQSTKKQKTPKGTEEALAAAREATAAAKEAQALIKAAGDPNDPRNIAQTDFEEGKIKSDLVESIRQLIAQHNRARARGTTGVFVNPERRDEAVSRAMTTGFAEARDQARTRARDFLLRSAAAQSQATGALTGAAGAFGFPTAVNAQTDQANRTNQANAVNAVLDAFQTPRVTNIFNGLGDWVSGQADRGQARTAVLNGSQNFDNRYNNDLWGR